VEVDPVRSNRIMWIDIQNGDNINASSLIKLTLLSKDVSPMDLIVDVYIKSFNKLLLGKLPFLSMLV
jgi:hypothetical protein